MPSGRLGGKPLVAVGGARRDSCDGLTSIGWIEAKWACATAPETASTKPKAAERSSRSGWSPNSVNSNAEVVAVTPTLNASTDCTRNSGNRCTAAAPATEPRMSMATPVMYSGCRPILPRSSVSPPKAPARRIPIDFENRPETGTGTEGRHEGEQVTDGHARFFRGSRTSFSGRTSVMGMMRHQSNAYTYS